MKDALHCVRSDQIQGTLIDVSNGEQRTQQKELQTGRSGVYPCEQTNADCENLVKVCPPESLVLEYGSDQ